MLIKPPSIVSPICNPTFDECERMQIIPAIKTATLIMVRIANHFVAQDVYLFISYTPIRKILIYLSVYRKFRLCITKAQGKAHTPEVERIQWLTPMQTLRLLRKLPTESGEGERVTMKLAQT